MRNEFRLIVYIKRPISAARWLSANPPIRSKTQNTVFYEAVEGEGCVKNDEEGDGGEEKTKELFYLV